MSVDPALRDKYLVDPYDNWARAQGAPVVHAPAVDLASLETEPWPHFGVRGAIAHVEGRCDFLTLFVFDLAPGEAARPLRHVYEELIYVVSGAGETEVLLSSGERRVIEWREGAFFSAPVNATCVHRANSEGARLASFNDLRYLMGLYRNEAFLFDNPAPFARRQARAASEPWIGQPRLMQLTNGEDGARGELCLADCALGASVVELSEGQSTLARRQMQGAHLLCVAGEGGTLTFADADGPVTRTSWTRGAVIGLPGMCFHQHVACGGPARFVIIELGSQASPIFRSRRAAYGDKAVYASGAALVERRDESAALRAARSA